MRRPSAASSIPAICGNRASLLAAAILCTVFQRPAIALVGRAQPARGDIARQVVMITSVRGAHCTGTVLAPNIVLTAAHCTSEATGLTVSRSGEAGAAGYKVLAVVVHPQYDATNYARSQAAIDLALLKLGSPLPNSTLVAMRGRVPLPGERFVVAGFGIMASGWSAGLGTLQTATLVVIGEPSSLQLRLADPASQGGAVAGLGSCDGDSGGPVFQRSGSRFVLVGVLSWSNGPNMSAGCGGVTGVTPLARHREWMIRTAREMGSGVNWVR
jgi:secreted trypsin-like serine protease